jgi:hypothetical protein
MWCYASSTCCGLRVCVFLGSMDRVVGDLHQDMRVLQSFSPGEWQ